jgi:ELWxxDGT repeat protein
MRPFHRVLLSLLCVFQVPAIANESYSFGLSSNPADFVVIGSRAYFRATTAVDGDEIWTTDGTPSGTKQVTKLASNVTLGSPFVHGGKALFLVVNDSVEVHEIDGTTSSLLAILNVPAGLVVSVESAGSFFAFVRRVPDTADWEIWRSDGTPAGTFLLETIDEPRAPILEPAGGRMFLSVAHNISFTTGDIWVTDGTVAGTMTLLTGATSLVRPFGDRVLAIKDGVWISDGTPAGTRQLTSVSGAAPFTFCTMGANAYFAAAGGLWTTDGTPEGTSLLKALTGPITVVAPMSGNRLVFTHTISPTKRVQFWITDGSATGTVLFQEMPYLTPPPFGAQSTGDQVFFTMMADSSGLELWRTDGTSEGTYQVKDIAKSISYPYPREMTAFQGRLLFSANDAVHGHEPWISDGTDAGTAIIGNVNPEGSLHGHVVDASTGAPLADARVWAYARPNEPPHLFDVGGDGSFSVEGMRNGSYHLYTAALTDSLPYIDQCWPASEILGSHECEGITVDGPVAQTGFDFRLRLGARLTGRVTDSSGNGIRGMVVYAGSEYGSGSTYDSTDVDGRYAIDALPPGSWRISIPQGSGYVGMAHPNVSCHEGCNAASGTPVNFAPGDIRTIDFTMKRQGRIQGRVRSSWSGQPVNGSLTVRGIGTTVPLSNGAFEITLPDGRYRLFLQSHDSDYKDTWYSTLGCRPCSEEQATFISATPETTTPGFDIVVPYAGNVLSGRVTHAAGGNPVSYMNVTVHATNGERLVTLTELDGTYSFKLIAGTYYVTTAPEGKYPSMLYDGHRGLPCNDCDVTTGTPVVVTDGDNVFGIDLVIGGLDPGATLQRQTP